MASNVAFLISSPFPDCWTGLYLTDYLFGSPVDWQSISRLAGCLIVCLTDWVTGTLIGSLADLLADWLTA